MEDEQQTTENFAEDFETYRIEIDKVKMMAEALYSRVYCGKENVAEFTRKITDALVARNHELTLEMDDIPKLMLDDEDGIIRNGIEKGFLDKRIADKLYPGQELQNFTFQEHTVGIYENKEIDIAKHKFDSSQHSKNIRAIGKGSWKSSAEEVKNTHDLLKNLAIFEHERTQLIDSYNHRKLREAVSIEQVWELQRKIRTQELSEKELDEIESLQYWKNEVFKNRSSLNTRLLNMEEPEVSAEAMDVTIMCPISKRYIKKAAFAKCAHPFDLDAARDIYTEKRKTYPCPVIGCLAKFKIADIREDAEYQNRINAKRKENIRSATRRQPASQMQSHDATL